MILHRTKRDRVRLEPELYKAFNISSVHMKPFVIRHLQSVENQVLRLTQEAEKNNLLTAIAPSEQKTFYWKQPIDSSNLNWFSGFPPKTGNFS